MHLEVQLTHAGDHHLPGLGVGSDLERRVLGGEPRQGPWPSFSWSALVFGSMASVMTGVGNSIASSTTGCARSQMVSPVATVLSPTAAAMSPA